MSVRQLNTADPQFEAEFSKLVARDASVDPEITRRAEAIVEDVRVRGDEAVLEYTNRFDRMSVSSMDELVITAEEMKAALDGLPAEQREALTEAAERIRKFHENELGISRLPDKEVGCSLLSARSYDKVNRRNALCIKIIVKVVLGKGVKVYLAVLIILCKTLCGSQYLVLAAVIQCDKNIQTVVFL